MQWLGIFKSVLQPPKVAEIIQHHCLVAAITLCPEGRQRLLQMRIGLLQLAFGHVDICDRCGNLPRQNAAAGFTVCKACTSQELACFRKLTTVLCVDCQ